MTLILAAQKFPSLIVIPKSTTHAGRAFLVLAATTFMLLLNRLLGSDKQPIKNRALLQIVGGDKLIIPFC